MVGTSVDCIRVERGAGSDAKLLNRHNGLTHFDLLNKIHSERCFLNTWTTDISYARVLPLSSHSHLVEIVCVEEVKRLKLQCPKVL